MTSRASLVYYLSAVVIGCLLMSLAVWLSPVFDAFRIKGGFFGFYLLGLLCGSLVAILHAFALRKLTVTFGWNRSWQWIVSGAAIAWVLTWALGSLALSVESLSSGWIFLLVLAGPTAAVFAGTWPTVLAGGATACFLHMVHRTLGVRR